LSPQLPHLFFTIIVSFFRQIVSFYLLLVPLSVVKVALATVPHPIGGDGSIAVIVVVVLVPLYSLPDAPLMHVRIAAGTIKIISRHAVLFFGMLHNLFICI